MKASAKTQKQAIWKTYSEGWKVSGISQLAYCEQKGISYRSFVYHHNRLLSESKKNSLNFIEAKPELAVINSQASGLQLILPNGIRIGIGAEIKAEQLRIVLSVAGAVPCLS